MGLESGGNTPCACGSTNGVHPRGTWGCAYEPAGGNRSSAEIAHEVAEWHNNTGGEFEKWLAIYIGAIFAAGFEVVRRADPGRIESH